jgi:DNA-binding transcriptional MerR regulator
MDEPGTLTVGTLARMAGVTVRTLQHYDEIGLLTPSGRSEAGYRRYTSADVGRLQQILFYRELGFGLDQVGEALADPGTTRSRTFVGSTRCSASGSSDCSGCRARSSSRWRHTTWASS